VRAKIIVLGLCCALSACASSSTRQDATLFATARVVTDFDSYQLKRVGLLPLIHAELLAEQSVSIQAGFMSEFSRSTPFEVVSLDSGDLAEIPGSDPYRRGWYDPRTIIALSKRYQLDAVFVGTLTDTQFFAPQRISVQVDLVACETGASIWTGEVHLDASEGSVRESLMAWRTDSSQDEYRGSEPSDLALISPRRFARFAAWQLAQLL